MQNPPSNLEARHQNVVLPLLQPHAEAIDWVGAEAGLVEGLGRGGLALAPVEGLCVNVNVEVGLGD
jgi:hypothetical protein